MLIYTDNYENALDFIFSEKKIKNKGDLLNIILLKKPDLKNKVDELCEKYKVKLEYN